MEVITILHPLFKWIFRLRWSLNMWPHLQHLNRKVDCVSGAAVGMKQQKHDRNFLNNQTFLLFKYAWGQSYFCELFFDAFQDKTSLSSDSCIVCKEKKESCHKHSSSAWSKSFFDCKHNRNRCIWTVWQDHVRRCLNETSLQKKY